MNRRVTVPVRTRKPVAHSKVVWANGVVLLLVAAESQLHTLQGVLPVPAYAVVAFALPLLNLALRLYDARVTEAPASNESMGE